MIQRKTINLKQTKQVKRYGKFFKEGSKIKHVVKHENGWAIKRTGASKASKLFKKQEKAINSAIKMAKNAGTAVVIHGRDGRIKDVKRYF